MFAIFKTFLWLGLTSFGGPMAHIAIFRRVFVEQQKRISDEAYANLVALCQLIPGPASSQVGLALGYRFGGAAGALVAWLGFTLPSALLMGLGAYLWLSGAFIEMGWVILAFKLVAVGVVTQAVIGMWGTLCVERTARIVALLAAILFYQFPNAWMQLALIGAALVGGDVQYRVAGERAIETPRAGRQSAFGLSLVGLVFGFVAVFSVWDFTGPLWDIVRGHFISGALVFGGGHVVLPLLQAEFVPPLGEAEFLAGYGLVQAMPGPLFTLAAYLGVLVAPETPWIAAALAVVMVFLPGLVLLTAGGLLGKQWMPWLRPRLSLVNAAVVGLLLSVLVHPVFTQSAYSGATTALAMVSLLMAVVWKRSPLELVAAMLVLSFAMQWMNWI